jgi:hypothetical protein
VERSPRSLARSRIVNWLHDWWYDSGFTEATHNAQRENFGRGGVANDPMLVLAQAGANIGNRNNANMATPADGARPRMRMYLWSAPTTTSPGIGTRYPGHASVSPPSAGHTMKLTIRIDDNEIRALWETARKASAEVESWPPWKHNEVPRAFSYAPPWMLDMLMPEPRA